METGTLRGMLLIIGTGRNRQFPLSKTNLYLGRADPSTGWIPDIDFSPDFKVSRRHARLFFRDDKWWLEDLGSKRGTFVGEDETKVENKPVQLPFNIPAKIGQTRWLILPHDAVWWEGLTINFERVRSVNYAAYHCGLPVISNLIITNQDSVSSDPFTLQILIPGWSQVWERKIPSLPPGGKKIISKVFPALLYEKLEGLEGRKKASLEIAINGVPVFDEKINILGFYEWPFEHSFRKSLACFVQPAHPIVEELAMEVTFILKSRGIALFNGPFERMDEYVEQALRTLYEYLARYRISYVHQAPSFELGSQVIRPPHRIIPKIERKQGQGTCIDLTLLFASCLESLHLQPLIVFIKENTSSFHAIVGCWRQVTVRVEPILGQYDKFKNALEKNQLILVETTGITDRFEKELESKLPYEEAKKLAYEQVTKRSFHFALDVAAARQTISPLQFPTEPVVAEVIRKARELALGEKGNSRLETKHLLLSLFLVEDPQLRRILEKANIDSNKVASLVSNRRFENNRFLRPTVNYRRALEDARFIIGDTGDTFIGPIHILYALLLSQSKSVDMMLMSIGTDKYILQKIVDKELMWGKQIIQTHYEDS